jgi:hypothetical protein
VVCQEVAIKDGPLGCGGNNLLGGGDSKHPTNQNLKSYVA